MALLGNIMWFLLGGWLLFLLYTAVAIILFPFFVPIFRIARYSLFPFGKSIVTKGQLNKYRELTGSQTEGGTASQDVEATKTATHDVSGLLNVVWVLTFGWFLALVHLLGSILNLSFFFLIVTIPNIAGHWKMIRVAFMPFNKVIVPEQVANEMEVELAKVKLNI